MVFPDESTSGDSISPAKTFWQVLSCRQGWRHGASGAQERPMEKTRFQQTTPDAYPTVPGQYSRLQFHCKQIHSTALSLLSLSTKGIYQSINQARNFTGQQEEICVQSLRNIFTINIRVLLKQFIRKFDAGKAEVMVQCKFNAVLPVECQLSDELASFQCVDISSLPKSCFFTRAIPPSSSTALSSAASPI